MLFNDVEGFGMNYEDFKVLCRETSKEKYSYLKVNRLDDEEKYCICNESKKQNKNFKPQTNPF